VLGHKSTQEGKDPTRKGNQRCNTVRLSNNGFGQGCKFTTDIGKFTKSRRRNVKVSIKTKYGGRGRGFARATFCEKGGGGECVVEVKMTGFL